MKKYILIFFILLTLFLNAQETTKLHINNDTLDVNGKFYDLHNLDKAKLKKILPNQKINYEIYIPKNDIKWIPILGELFVGYSIEFKQTKEILPEIHDERLNGLWQNKEETKWLITPNKIESNKSNDSKKERTILEISIKFTIVKNNLIFTQANWKNKHYWKDLQGNVLDYTCSVESGPFSLLKYQFKIEKSKLILFMDGKEVDTFTKIKE